jgi:ATP phosphoribosyltransferase regulatory subunit
MATILPHTAQRIRLLEDRLLATLGRWGYQEIIPPTFEYLDVLQHGLEPDLLESSFKFADRATGRIVVLRPDVTAQIARIVAMGMIPAEPPLRLSYRTTVFRYEPQHAGREQEIFQVGAELIGPDTAVADAEIIGLMIDGLTHLGLPSFQISLGHVGFFKGVLAQSGLSRDGQKRAEQAAARKDLPRLEELLAEERIIPSRSRPVLEAPGLYGREEVLARGRTLAGRNRGLHACLERLTAVYRLLCQAGWSDRLLLDLGEFRGFDYYDGVVFDVFAKGIGCELGGGGRYNHLIGRFGRPLPSTGFAFDVDRLFRAMERVTGTPEHRPADLLLTGRERDAGTLFRIANQWRDGGVRVVHGSPLRGPGIKTAIAEGRRCGVLGVAIIGTGTLRADEALLVYAVGARDRGVRTSVMKIKDVPDAPWKAGVRL